MAVKRVVYERCYRCGAIDAPHHAKNAAKTRRMKLPQLDLFDRAALASL